MKSKICLIRHGITRGNRDRLYYGQSDIPLIDDGKAEIARLAEADGVPCRDRTVPWARRWGLFADWIQAHPEVFDTARDKASMECGQRRWRAAGRAQPGDGPHDRQTIMQADNQPCR